MKKLTASFVALVLALTLSACTVESADFTAAGLPVSEKPLFLKESPISTDTSSVSQTDAFLTRDEAISIALQDAGLNKSAVWDLEAERDWEWGVTVWEVDFDFGALEYSYVLNAKTGNILHREIERD